MSTPSRWWLRIAVVLLVLVGLAFLQQHQDANSGCLPWEHVVSVPGGAGCESYF